MKRIVFTLLIALFLNAVFVFAFEYAPGHLIVRFHDNNEGNIRSSFVSLYSQYEMREESVLSERSNIVLYKFDNSLRSEISLLDEIRANPLVHSAQLDAIIERRSEFIPNDSLFYQQWHLKNTGQNGGVIGADISATQAWDAYHAAGGHNNNREIVIAVPDGGFKIDHEDINWWRNTTEHCHIHGLNLSNCPNPNRRCDYYGWNTLTNPATAAPPRFPGSYQDQHGTVVSGLVGASVDNNLQGAGIGGMPGLKIMPIMTLVRENPQTLNSRAIASYDYIIAKRQLWNETGGQYGAYIVAVNSSWGSNATHPDSLPVWRDKYYEMGQLGILSINAVENNNRNISILGDMPGTVESPWTISVSSLNNQNVRFHGWSPNHVHLHAYGINPFTAIHLGTGTAEAGTSYAAPQIAGTIGLMYLSASEQLLSSYDQEPATLAFLVKQNILQGVDLLPSLSGRSITGGKLNAFNALKLMQESDGDVVIRGSLVVERRTWGSNNRNQSYRLTALPNNFIVSPSSGLNSIPSRVEVSYNFQLYAFQLLDLPQFQSNFEQGSHGFFSDYTIIFQSLFFIYFTPLRNL